MKALRKFIFWAHLAAGVLAGGVILVMSVTGVLLTYERQITERADAFHLPSQPGLPSLETLLGQRSGPQPTAVTVDRDSSKPVMLQFGREKTEFIHPADGTSLGPGNTAVRRFFKEVTAWHRWLGREGAAQPTGRAVIGAGNLVFLFLVMSGLILWCPRRASWPALRAVLLFRRGLAGRARDWNWHHVLGFWFSLPLFLIVVSGVVMSYPWANALVFRLAGESPPQGGGRPPNNSRPAGGRPGSEAGVSWVGIDAALATVVATHPDWRTIQLQLPPGKAASFSVATSHRGRPDLKKQVTVDLASATLIKSEGMESQTPGRRARTWMRWIHTGEAGGFAGQTVAGLSSLAAVVLVWTGFALTWRRLRKKFGSP